MLKAFMSRSLHRLFHVPLIHPSFFLILQSEGGVLVSFYLSALLHKSLDAMRFPFSFICLQNDFLGS